MRRFRQTDPSGRRRRGLSLIEVTIAITLLSMIGYVAALSLRAGDQSLATVSSTIEINTSYREATGKLRGELKAAERSSITIVNLASGDRSIEFRTAIRGAGGPTWGVFDRRLAIDETACHKDGWTVRYTVLVNGAGTKTLVRQVLDTAGTLQLVENLVTDVMEFRVTETGSVWVIELRTEGARGKRYEEFDVRTRDD